MNTQDLRLAVVHKIVSELRDVGKTKVQKIVYFLQVAKEVPTAYTFKMHHYGPFAEAVETDTAKLRLDQFVEVRPDLMGYGFHIIPGTSQPEKEWTYVIGQYEQSIKEVLEELGRRPTSELELLATIHYVHKLTPRPEKDDVLHKVKALKPKFDGSYIESCYIQLKQLGFL